MPETSSFATGVGGIGSGSGKKKETRRLGRDGGMAAEVEPRRTGARRRSLTKVQGWHLRLLFSICVPMNQI